ncbi:hypothetical protein QN382_19815 [Pseudomonas sp. 10B1]|uniref:hypothetical protein n=1 Tax=unclassified Pseudomonas TaxID=196821 RepID=UPI002B236ADD|nr:MULTISPECIES: hypothetical protein [unclassified Pseudomonas]MEA9994555.1 hypothetical protein [Pseudomonas sp. AA4]MEB0085700.1 hypothetical protein [Pseudomonas sp. RTI1]MEB0125975.1 hypothetical protein [Pseudomonas sp. CCC1.2]MEB0152779.1 hypothetical protein [Pseudomonas sp. CCC4.3]MEB0221284.1 hypothetical protein [Pseudomonas sp. AB12(2023)]
MTYRNVVSAVVRALAAETINSAGGCDFEPKVQCAKQKGEIVGKEAAFLTDCWVFGRLHKGLSVEQWRALVARYSTHEERKHVAILELINSVRSPASQRFSDCAVLTWAIPQIPGAEGKRSATKLPDAWYDITNWGNDGRPESTRYRWRASIKKWLDDQVNDALSDAGDILELEGLIESCAA